MNRGLIAFLLVPFLAGAAGAARVGVKRVNGDPVEPAARQESAPVDGGRVKVRPVGPRTGGSERPSSPDPARSRGRERVYERRGSPVRVDPIGSGTVDRSAPGRSIGAGRTRVVRQSPEPAPERHGAIIGNRAISRSIAQQRRVEVVPDRHYWHNVDCQRYCHYYRGGIHWYGFYHGPYFYWTRYHRDRWWWYDPGFNHWVYWSNGRWWWPSPSGIVYVYVNDSYYPQDEAPVPVEAPSPVAPPPEATANPGGEWTSPDGKRLVQVHGPQSEAFLYDNTGKQPEYLGLLGKDVEKVRFSGGTDGRPARILLDFKNGDFALFTSEGEPLDLEPPPAPPAPPDSPKR